MRAHSLPRQAEKGRMLGHGQTRLKGALSYGLCIGGNCCLPPQLDGVAHSLPLLRPFLTPPEVVRNPLALAIRSGSRYLGIFGLIRSIGYEGTYLQSFSRKPLPLRLFNIPLSVNKCSFVLHKRTVQNREPQFLQLSAPPHISNHNGENGRVGWLDRCRAGWQGRVAATPCGRKNTIASKAIAKAVRKGARLSLVRPCSTALSSYTRR